MAANPLVTIGIMAFNRRDEVSHTLTRIAEITYEPLEVLVVDNASADQTAEMVAAEFPSVRLIRLEENVGEEAKNTMLREARGEHIVILDDDSYPLPGAVERIVAILESDPTVGVVAGKIFSTVTGEPWPNPILPESDEICEAYAYIGCGVGMRREVALALGGYAGFFFIYEVETELALRFWAKGHRVLYDPCAHFEHRVAPANRTSERQVLYSTRNTLMIAHMYTSGLRKWNLLLGINLFYWRMAKREGLVATWRRARREVEALRPAWEKRRLPIPRETWKHFRPWLKKYQATSILRRKLGLDGR